MPTNRPDRGRMLPTQRHLAVVSGEKRSRCAEQWTAHLRSGHVAFYDVMSLVRAAWLIFAIILMACQRTQQSALDRLHPCKIDEGPTEAFCGQYSVFEESRPSTSPHASPNPTWASRISRTVFATSGSSGAAPATPLRTTRHRIPTSVVTRSFGR